LCLSDVSGPCRCMAGNATGGIRQNSRNRLPTELGPADDRTVMLVLYADMPWPGRSSSKAAVATAAAGVRQ
jgi:hypothetical protein